MHSQNEKRIRCLISPSNSLQLSFCQTHSKVVRTPTLDTEVDIQLNLEEFHEDILGHDTIQKGAPLARGGMATVFNGKYGVIPVALKGARGFLNNLLKEAATVMKLRHPNVVHVYGIWKDRDERVFLVCSIVPLFPLYCHCCVCVFLPLLFSVVNLTLAACSQVLEFCVNRDISLHITKPFTEVSALQRQQWVLQVSGLMIALSLHPANSVYPSP